MLKNRTKRAITGYAFISPFIIGVFLIFSYAVISSIMFACSDISIGESGYKLSFAGIKYFKEILLVHPTYNKTLITSLKDTLINVPLVIMFSFFMAYMLNQNFKGRSFVRVIFFTPVILSTGILQKMDNFREIENGLSGSTLTTTISQFGGTFDLSSFLLSLDIAPQAIAYISNGVESIYQIINMSGIQMLIFLMALQSISPSLYEASSIEGATAWENMWKITFPLVTPYILTTAVYTVIDSFSSYNNPVMEEIQTVSQGSTLNYSMLTSMSIIYFLFIALILGIMTFLLSKIVFYQD